MRRFLTDFAFAFIGLFALVTDTRRSQRLRERHERILAQRTYH